ncbi:MAG: hypothetical protein GFH25_541210n18 [Chloroflexi bacterium AL-N10]|nr:hypothetical protein [Chloroflexi bacterium AL-N1]NOK69591.1 hypothetical protein [Chloroflexi bacterium AL-N10]NOK72138.1 hypothetical protein [Chloroflexi bacterium AL-N5]
MWCAYIVEIDISVCIYSLHATYCIVCENTHQFIDSTSIPYLQKTKTQILIVRCSLLLLIHAIMLDVLKFVREFTCFSDGSLSIRINAAYDMPVIAVYTARPSQSRHIPSFCLSPCLAHWCALFIVIFYRFYQLLTRRQ